LEVFITKGLGGGLKSLHIGGYATQFTRPNEALASENTTREQAKYN
jgi:hypothetical protein